MVICNNKNFFFITLNFFLILFFINLSYAEINFKKLEDKKVSYLDFFLLKFENKLTKRANVLGAQTFATRVQYSSIGIQVNFDDEKKAIITEIYAIMNKMRYSKKKYIQKVSDCNQVRNLMFYRKSGYKFFSQKRDPSLSQDIMEDIFEEVFLNNLSLNEKEIDFLSNNMFVKVTIYHPVNKEELICSGKINQYELNRIY